MTAGLKGLTPHAIYYFRAAPEIVPKTPATGYWFPAGGAQKTRSSQRGNPDKPQAVSLDYLN
jgi:hypothetical protein